MNPSYVVWRKKCEEVSGIKNQINTAKTSLEEAKAAVKQAEVALDGAKKREPEVDRLKQVISRIDDEEQKYQQKEELEAKRKELAESDKKLSTEEADLKENEKALKEKIESLNKTVKELRDKPAELIEAKNQSEKLTGLMEVLNTIIADQIPEREKRKRALSKKQKSFLAARDKYEEASGRREEAERMLEDSRAGILAGKLVEGEKCPVCGSVHHPEPAKRKESSISEDEFKKLQEEEAELQEEKNRANTEAEKAKTSLEEFEGRLGATILECMKSPFLDMEGEEESLEELIGAVKEAKPQVETMSEECHQKCIVLEEDCGKLQN